MSKEAVQPLEGKVEAIRSFPQPKTMKQLRRFLEKVNLYRRFVPNATKTLQPLEQLLSPPQKQPKTDKLEQEHERSFH